MSSRLGTLDAAWLHMERADNPMMVTGVLWFDGPLEVSRLKQALRERLLDVYPRFTERVVDPAGPFTARWEPDPAFHLDNHVHERSLPEPGGRAELQDLVSDLASMPLDLRFSPWQFHLVHGFERGSALVGRIHHCVADGIALARVLLGLTDGAGRLPDDHPMVQRRAWADLPLDTARAALHGIEDAADLVRHPERIARALRLGAEGLADVERLVFLPPDALTPLRNPLGVRKRVGWAGPVPLAEVKRIGRATDCTVNDVLVSAMAGALGEHLRSIQADVETVRAFVPVNLRPLDEPVPRELGNTFSLVVVDLPVGEPDARTRLDLVSAEMTRLKSGVEPMVTWFLFQLLGTTPVKVEEWIVDFFGRKASCVLTNVPGPREPVAIAGVPVRGVMVWVPQTGPIGVGLSIFSYAGEVTVGVAADANCVPDPEGLARRFSTAFAELSAAVPLSPRPTG